MDYSTTYYKNNFLNQVIVRVDFVQFILNNVVFDHVIEKEILKVFPRRGKDRAMRSIYLLLVRLSGLRAGTGYGFSGKHQQLCRAVVYARRHAVSEYSARGGVRTQARRRRKRSH